MYIPEGHVEKAYDTLNPKSADNNSPQGRISVAPISVVPDIINTFTITFKRCKK